MRLLGIGGAHIDRRGQVTGDYVPAASNPGTMHEDVGGGTLNALRNAVQRGVECALISVRGGDAAGEMVAKAAVQAKIEDLSVTFLDRATPSYTALLDRHGELISGFADMGLYDLAFPKQMRRSAVRNAVARADAVLCDANIPAAGLERLAVLTADIPLFAIGVSPAKVIRLKIILPRLACLFLNRREVASLTGLHGDTSEMLTALKEIGLRSAVITAGGEPIVGYSPEECFSLAPPAPRRVVDVTGAGDALTGTTIAAMMAGAPLTTALREGVAASLLAIESQAAVPNLSKSAFTEVLALVPQPEAMA